MNNNGIGIAGIVFCLGLGVPQPAAADALAYVTLGDFGGGDGIIGTLDLNTGQFTEVAPTVACCTTRPTLTLFSSGGSLYGAQYDSFGPLYVVDPANGDLTAIGSTGSVPYYVFGSTTNELFNIPANGNFYSIDQTTGAQSLIAAGIFNPALDTFSEGSPVLYMGDGNSLYTVNTSTGSLTLHATASLNFSESNWMIYEDGLLYVGIRNPTQEIYTVDPSTGSTSFLTDIQNTQGSSCCIDGLGVWGVAPDAASQGSSSPEPGTMLMLLGTLAAWAGWRWRWRGSHRRCACCILSFMQKDAAGTKSGRVTQLLHQASAGDRAAADELLRVLESELRSLAALHMKRERSNHTLQTTAVMNEAVLRLLGDENRQWNDRQHFLSLASRIMRRVLVDYARAAQTQKRGAQTVILLTSDGAIGPVSDDVLDVHGALEEFAQIAPRQAELVELRFFGGLSMEEAAEVLGISPRMADKDWVFARAWLRRRLTAEPTAPISPSR